MRIRPSRSDYVTVLLIVVAIVLMFAACGGVGSFFRILFHRGPA
jgi:hypothetical protein